MTDTFNPLLHNLRPTNFRQGEWVKGRGTWDEIARPVLRVGSAALTDKRTPRAHDWLGGGNRSNGLGPRAGFAPR